MSDGLCWHEEHEVIITGSIPESGKGKKKSNQNFKI